MADNTAKRVKKVIAQECGLSCKDITNKTLFLPNNKFTYFDCMGALYTLQHEFHIELPEAEYKKYKTVGSLVRCIIKRVKEEKSK